MTEKENVATYARIRPYNPAINEDKRLTARCIDENAIVNATGDREDTYNFTRAFDMTDSTQTLFNDGMKPLLDFKILQGINSIFIVYGQSGSGKSFTLIGEDGHLGVLPMSLQYLLDQEDKVRSIKISAIEAYGIKATKIGFYDLVKQLELKKEAHKNRKKKGAKPFDVYSSIANSRVNSSNAAQIPITKDNVLQIIIDLQEVSHMAPTLKNPHSSRGHTCYFAQIKMKELEDVYFIAVDLAGSEGQTALGTKNEFVEGLTLAMSKGKLDLDKKKMNSIEAMYKTRSLEAGCINNGLTQLQSIFGELIRKKISKAQGLGLRKVLSSFITLKSAYAILFTLSASANNNKVTKATLNFAKQTQLVKVETQKAKKKIDKDAIIKKLEEIIKTLRKEMGGKNKTITDLKKQLAAGGGGSGGGDDDKNYEIKVDKVDGHQRSDTAFDEFDTLSRAITEANREEAKWNVGGGMVAIGDMNDDQLKEVFAKFDEDGGGTIDAEELQKALEQMGQYKDIQEINRLILEVDEDQNGEIDFDEFKVMVGKTWFIDAFQNELAKKVEKMMQSQANIFADDDVYGDEKEEKYQKIKTDDTDDDGRTDTNSEWLTSPKSYWGARIKKFATSPSDEEGLQSFKDAITNDAIAWGIFAALLMTVGFAGILVAEEDWKADNGYNNNLIANFFYITFEYGVALASFIAVIIGTLKYSYFNNLPPTLQDKAVYHSRHWNIAILVYIAVFCQSVASVCGAYLLYGSGVMIVVIVITVIALIIIGVALNNQKKAYSEMGMLYINNN